MKFVNKGNPIQVRLKDRDNRYMWIGVKTGETIDLPEEVGRAHGFEEFKTTEGKINEEKVETKQIEVSDFKTNTYWERLRNIKGIGKKTVEDIIKVYPDEEELIKAISENKKLPFRDDVENKLRGEYGRQS
jgi:hypothetical protein